MIHLRDNRFADYGRKLHYDMVSCKYIAEAVEGLPKDSFVASPEKIWPLLEKYNGKSINDLVTISNGKLLVLGNPDTKQIEAFYKIDSRKEFSPKREYPEKFTIDTSNLMGVLKLHDNTSDATMQIEILSRFDKNNRQFFLNYLLSRVFKVNFVDTVSASSASMWEILPTILFLKKLEETAPIGFYRQYQHYECNDLKFRGRLNLDRHIRHNYPFGANIAYTKREITFDNPINHLFRHALSRITKKWPFLISTHMDLRDMIQKLEQHTPTWHDNNILKTLKHRDCQEPIRHPFFAEYYEDLRNLAIMILAENGMSHYQAADEEVSGVIFDGAWLWEEYLANILEPKFIHAEYNTATGAHNIFKTTPQYKGMTTLYPDFYSNELSTVLDAKYKKAEFIREDIHQMLAYILITGAKTGGLIYPPDEETKDHKIVIDQKFQSSQTCHWQSFAFAKPRSCDQYESFEKFMKQQENKLREQYDTRKDQ